MYETKEQVNPLVADPKTFELDAFLHQSWRSQFVQVFSRIRHQAAIAGIVAIVATLWCAGVQAHHTLILTLSIGCIAGIAIGTEWIHGRRYDNTEQREAKSGHASKDQGAAR